MLGLSVSVCSARMEEIIASGVLGDIDKVYGNFHFPGKPGATPAGSDSIRYDSALAGGCMMDCGWYALNVIRVLMGRQVPDVISAEAQVWPHDPVRPEERTHLHVEQ
jgi:predicted dehydrogenase